MRYAIYFAAEADDRLMQLGNTWLGRDPFTGGGLSQPEIAGLAADKLRELTASPRRYGFHGTLKAPFFLREGKNEAALLETCAEFANRIAPFEIKGLDVNRLGKFLALTPNDTEPGLRAFAAQCLRAFEPFRAPLSPADLERRRKSDLTRRQDAYLTDWGYPYIFDEFRFHMTLSNKLENEAEADTLAQAAQSYFAEVTGRPRTCRTFALYMEREAGGPFQVLNVFTLTGNITPQAAEDQTGEPTRKENV
ncbi:DUF1045 domain-containing protein [Labrenzia sp. OB1]|uniref:DUF1045 domain-containing protein n=1 Tax=Labrenzia sp. OB1 TaxID=1561204 RepID=UPI0007B2B8D2|nr:DUF1045 domain-containing protein [Labrenzia sp. OB1]KZM51322.1 hypothetical protein OA90_05055 [Labrenzia sp. OB1]